MRSVLISIQPKWSKEIFVFLGYDNRRPLYKKRVELRKSKPKLDVPFKCFIYCTKDNTDYIPSRIWWKADKTGFQHIMNGKVIGEFVCDYILSHCEMANADMAEQMSCVSREDILKYSNGKEVYGWHISDLVIYDKPKELSEFKPYNRTEDDCEFSNLGYAIPKCEDCHECYVKRPPQSWCYVEERK